MGITHHIYHLAYKNISLNPVLDISKYVHWRQTEIPRQQHLGGNGCELFRRLSTKPGPYIDNAHI
jgi:hypothetical protein